ncbi:MAG: sugar ABC transporter substrate-binding protein [Clostridiales bacterium]|nr:sugar ABC transporter substrate-binding protein [Clostridiales bacterium]
MKLFKKILAGMLCAAMLVGATACSGNGDADNSSSQATPDSSVAQSDGEKGTIGGSFYDLKNEYFQNMAKGTKEGVEALGYTYEEHDQKSDESEMVTGATNLINKGVKALIISPIAPESLGSVVTAAKAKGIPVVVDDIGGGGSEYDVIVVSDCYKGGQLAADKIDATLKEKKIEGKNVASITCEASAVYAARRNAGYEDRMKELGYTIVKTVSADSDTAKGKTAMTDIMTANPDVVAVFCGNDNMAMGAVAALADLGLTGKVQVVGFDGNTEAVEAIKAGTLLATVAQDPVGMGKLTAELADKLIKGETLEYDNADEREMHAEVKLIDATNA